MKVKSVKVTPELKSSNKIIDELRARIERLEIKKYIQ